MRILYLSGGARAAALRYILEAGENVVGVITPVPSEQNSRFLEVIETAEEFDIPVYSIPKGEVHDLVVSLSPDVMVSCGYSYILEQRTLDIPTYAINLHPSLLPQYRGYRSGPYIILNNEKKSGVTVHFMHAEMDRGNILVQKSFPLTEFDTQRSLYRKNQQVEPQALLEALLLLRKGKVAGEEQDESQASEYNYMRTPKDSRIDPSKSLLELYNEIRACDHERFPAFFEIAGEKVCIQIWRPEKPEDEKDMI